jgi:hypothetical protein
LLQIKKTFCASSLPVPHKDEKQKVFRGTTLFQQNGFAALYFPFTQGGNGKAY